nr:zinc knuckle CX2CX4HX4C [Tanacetum cinerariifolium]
VRWMRPLDMQVTLHDKRIVMQVTLHYEFKQKFPRKKWIAFLVVEYFVRNNWAKYGLTRVMMNSKGLFFFMFDSIKGLDHVLENGPCMICNNLIILSKWTMNTRPCKEDLSLISVWVKIHDVLIQVFSEDGISLISSQIGNPVMLDSFTSSMCIESWGRSSFACCLIEIKVDGPLQDIVTMGIPLPKGRGFIKGTVYIEYEWKPPRCEQCKKFGHMDDQCPKKVATTLNVVDNNRF